MKCSFNKRQIRCLFNSQN